MEKKAPMQLFQSWMRTSDDGVLSEDGKYITFSTEILEDKVNELMQFPDSPKVKCDKCNGDGYTAEHDNWVNPETGEHDCSTCPIRVPCKECLATGFKAAQSNDAEMIEFATWVWENVPVLTPTDMNHNLQLFRNRK